MFEQKIIQSHDSPGSGDYRYVMNKFMYAANGTLPMKYEDTRHVAGTQSSDALILICGGKVFMGAQVSKN